MRVLFRLLSFLPLAALHGLGTGAGWLAYLLSPTYRHQLDTNLKRAMGAQAARGLRWTAAAHAGRMSLELPAIWLKPHKKVLGMVRAVSGAAAVDEARAKGGVVFITPHLGCFEIAGQYCASLAPLTALYRPPRRASLMPLVLAGRQRGQMTLAAADLSGVRQLLRALRRGENVGLLPDQAPAYGEGVWADFFGAPAYTMTLVSRLIDQPAVTPLLVWAERLPWGRGFHLHFSALSGPLTGDAGARATQLNHELEALIRRCPAQYLWGYNRYKAPEGVTHPGKGAAS